VFTSKILTWDGLVQLIEFTSCFIASFFGIVIAFYDLRERGGGAELGHAKAQSTQRLGEFHHA
jgi:hypothetical protein